MENFVSQQQTQHARYDVAPMNSYAAPTPLQRFNAALAGMGGLAFLCWLSGLLMLARNFGNTTTTNPERIWLWALLGLALTILFAILLGFAQQLHKLIWAFATTLLTSGAWLAFATAQSVYGKNSETANGATAITLVLCLGLCLYAIIAETKAAHKREIMAANLDPLTSTFTREAFMRHRPHLPSNTNSCLVMLEINDHKSIRKTQGLAASDSRLVHAAKHILETLPKNGMAARWDNNLFVVLLPGQNQQQAKNYVNHLQHLLPNPRRSLPVFSVGISETTGGPLERSLAVSEEQLRLDKEQQRDQETRITGVRELSTFDDFSSRLEKLAYTEDIIEIGLRLAAEFTGFDGGQYIPYEQGRFVLGHVCFRRGKIEMGALPLVGKLSFETKQGLVGQAIATGTAQFCSDYTNDWRAREDNNLHFIKSIIVLPVRRHNQVVALLSLFNNQTWKPITPNVRRALEAVASRLKHALELHEALEKERQTLEHSLAIPGLSLEARDFETAGHTERVVKLAVRLGSELGLKGADLDALRQGAYLHDIGKLAVDNDIVLKRGQLSADEWVVIRNHTILGAALVERIPSLPRGAIDVVRYHHERWDGMGYPRGLQGENIPFAARIFTICDIYDALISKRPYKIAWPEQEAIEELRQLSGRNLDPRVVEIFIERVLDNPSLN